MANDPPLNKNQLQAIDMLIDGVPKSKVARILKLHKTTVFGWYKRQKFVDELERRKTLKVNVLQKAINDKAMTAVDVLAEVMVDVEAKPADRIRAAGMLLDKARPMLMQGLEGPKKEVVELACWVSGTDEDGTKVVPEFVEADFKDEGVA